LSINPTSSSAIMLTPILIDSGSASPSDASGRPGRPAMRTDQLYHEGSQGGGPLSQGCVA
jgi:hypothetical protein